MESFIWASAVPTPPPLGTSRIYLQGEQLTGVPSCPVPGRPSEQREARSEDTARGEGPGHSQGPRGGAVSQLPQVGWREKWGPHHGAAQAESGGRAERAENVRGTHCSLFLQNGNATGAADGAKSLIPFVLHTSHPNLPRCLSAQPPGSAGIVLCSGCTSPQLTVTSPWTVWQTCNSPGPLLPVGGVTSERHQQEVRKSSGIKPPPLPWPAALSSPSASPPWDTLLFSAQRLRCSVGPGGAGLALAAPQLPGWGRGSGPGGGVSPLWPGKRSPAQ